jgi:hypothetical protein
MNCDGAVRQALALIAKTSEATLPAKLYADAGYFKLTHYCAEKRI